MVSSAGGVSPSYFGSNMDPSTAEIGGGSKSSRTGSTASKLPATGADAFSNSTAPKKKHTTGVAGFLKGFFIDAPWNLVKSLFSFKGLLAAIPAAIACVAFPVAAPCLLVGAGVLSGVRQIWQGAKTKDEDGKKNTALMGQGVGNIFLSGLSLPFIGILKGMKATKVRVNGKLESFAPGTRLKNFWDGFRDPEITTNEKLQKAGLVSSPLFTGTAPYIMTEKTPQNNNKQNGES